VRGCHRHLLHRRSPKDFPIGWGRIAHYIHTDTYGLECVPRYLTTYLRLHTLLLPLRPLSSALFWRHENRKGLKSQVQQQDVCSLNCDSRLSSAHLVGATKRKSRNLPSPTPASLRLPCITTLPQEDIISFCHERPPFPAQSRTFRRKQSHLPSASRTVCLPLSLLPSKLPTAITMSAPMVEYARIPHRKPLPGSMHAAQQPQPSQVDLAMRIGSISGQSQSQYPTMSSFGNPQTRRTLSNATSSTNSSHNSIRRSSSGRSSGPPPTSYVALLRKQKATVWCDRSQTEDPRIRIQQRMAKERAEREVTAGPMGQGRLTPASGSSGSFTGGVARKIRHHGGKPVQYTGGNLAGAGVPLRLSATEVDDEPENARNSKAEDDIGNGWERDPAWGYAGSQNHRRTPSGRSSLGSQRRTNSGFQRFSTAGSTPTSGHSRSPSETHLPHLSEETPVPPANQRQASSYFTSEGANTPSSEEENAFGAMGDLPKKSEIKNNVPKKETTDDLIRRGSVDERTMTMGRQRLFVANPDLSD